VRAALLRRRAKNGLKSRSGRKAICHNRTLSHIQVAGKNRKRSVPGPPIGCGYAPFAPECQSFLDNLPAGFGAKGSANDPTGKPVPPVFIAVAIDRFPPPLAPDFPTLVFRGPPCNLNVGHGALVGNRRAPDIRRRAVLAAMTKPSTCIPRRATSRGPVVDDVWQERVENKLASLIPLGRFCLTRIAHFTLQTVPRSTNSRSSGRSVFRGQAAPQAGRAN
jgi:hypothetical protein